VYISLSSLLGIASDAVLLRTAVVTTIMPGLQVVSIVECTLDDSFTHEEVAGALTGILSKNSIRYGADVLPL
jgi:hypothetical protein